MSKSPKEKAKELVDKYRKYVDDGRHNGFYNSQVTFDNQKQCALLLVDEILQTFNVNWQWCSVAMEDKALWSKEFEFWKEVKQEIEKL
jgi:hypothetical protein